MKKWFDRVQIWLYLAGLPTIASWVGRFGSPPVLIEHDDVHERITLPEIGIPTGREHLEGVGWRLDEFPPEPLRIIDFDNTFNDNRLIDMGRDVALPHSKLDVN